jgi:hypothetical protein
MVDLIVVIVVTVGCCTLFLALYHGLVFLANWYAHKIMPPGKTTEHEYRKQIRRIVQHYEMRIKELERQLPPGK